MATYAKKRTTTALGTKVGWTAVCVLWTIALSQKTATVGYYKLEYFDEQRTYKQANKTCTGKDAWLVEIKTREMDIAVENLKRRAIWIGLSYANNTWKWEDGSRARYTNWSQNIAPVANSKDETICAKRTSTGWKKDDCTKTYSFVCQSDADYPDNYKIEVFDELKKTFFEANQSCYSDQQSSLVNLKTASIRTATKKLIRNTTKLFFTSGNDINEEGTWRWSDGATFSSNNSIWVENRPDGGTNENCLAVRYSSSRIELMDVSCNSTLAYICQNKCTANTCLNNGNCTSESGRYKCTCTPGHFGTRCEKNLISITASRSTITVAKGNTPAIDMAVISYDEDVNVTLKKCNDEIIETITVEIIRPGEEKQLQFSLGVQLMSMRYLFDAEPTSTSGNASSYRRTTSIDVSVTGSTSATATSPPDLTALTCALGVLLLIALVVLTYFIIKSRTKAQSPDSENPAGTHALNFAENPQPNIQQNSTPFDSIYETPMQNQAPNQTHYSNVDASEYEAMDTYETPIVR